MRVKWSSQVLGYKKIIKKHVEGPPLSPPAIANGLFLSTAAYLKDEIQFYAILDATQRHSE